MTVNPKESIQNCLADAGLKELPIDWDVLELGSILDNDRGISVGVMYPGKFCSAGTPLIKAGDLKHDYINPLLDFYISPEKHYEHRRTALEGGEILLSLVGNLGQCAVVPSEMAGFNIARAVALIRLHQPKDAEYVKLCLQSPPLQYLMQSWATTTVQATLNLKEIKKLPIPWPNITEREAIVSVLKPLLNKIELNRRMNETLEAMAKALFKSWFVDFDPVRAKAAGRPPEDLAPEIAALFPDGFEDSELGEIPKGWRVGKLGEEFRHTMGQSPPGETYNEIGEGLPFYQGRTDFGFRYPTPRIYCSAPTRIAEAGDTLVSVRAPVGDINMAPEKSCLGRGVASVKHKLDGISYTYYALKNIQHLFHSFEAEGTVFGSINKKDFENLSLICPSESLIVEFESIVKSFDMKIQLASLQIVSLIQLRDYLLPKLMSGEIRVQQAQSLVEELV